MVDPIDARSVVDTVYRTHSRRVLASLVRILGGFDLAEEALHDAFAAAVERWPRDGVPAKPVAWLISTGRFRAIDALRRRAHFDRTIAPQLEWVEATIESDPTDAELDDDQLRMIFVCCHPALGHDARVALTLREVCGLTTEDIARAYLTTPSTIAQRIVRAKAKMRDSAIPYRVPDAPELPARLDAVLRVIYLVFNEGYSATAGDTATRPDLSTEAIRLGRLVQVLLPTAETTGLLALMLLIESRRAARTTPEGDVILLEHQDRAGWDQSLIAEGTRLAEVALSGPNVGPYAYQAAINAVHATARTAAGTDWSRIVELYDRLFVLTPTSIVRLNRAVAVAFRDGPAAGIDLIDVLLRGGELVDYHLAHAALADLLRRAGRRDEAAESYRRALELTKQEPERRLIEAKLAEVS